MTDTNPSAPPLYQESGPSQTAAVTSPPYPQPGQGGNVPLPTEPPPKYEPPKHGQPGVNYGYNGTQPQYPPQGYQTGSAPTIYGQVQPITVIQTRLGPHPAIMDCPFCHSRINTTVLYETGALTWLVSGILCLFGCWLGCCLIPFCVNDLQDAIHKCPNCQHKVGVFRRLN